MTTTDVCALVGVSPRQLQYWDERKILQPTLKEGYGHAGWIRDWPEDEVALAKVVKEARRKGLSIQRIKKAITFLRPYVDHPGYAVFFDQGRAIGWYPTAVAVIEAAVRAPKPIVVVQFGWR